MIYPEEVIDGAVYVYVILDWHGVRSVGSHRAEKVLVTIHSLIGRAPRPNKITATNKQKGGTSRADLRKT